MAFSTLIFLVFFLFCVFDCMFYRSLYSLLCLYGQRCLMHINTMIRYGWLCLKIQYNAMQCNAMQCNAMQCNAMQCNALHCIALHCIAATLRMMVVALVHSRLDYGNGVLVGLPAYLMRQLQSVLNAAARLIFRLKSSNHISDAWLRVPERIHYKLAVMAYKVLLGRAPSYLGPLVRVADVSGRRALRSAGTNRILVPPVTSNTVGSRAFSVAAPLIWNSLLDDVISAESLPTFQRKLKRHLFCQSFPGFCY